MGKTDKTTEQHFDTLISDAMKIGIEKMSIYGTSWTSYRPGSLMTRMLNKGKRIVTIQETKDNQVGEKISDGFKEIMNYAALLGIMLEHKIELYKELNKEEVTSFRDIIFKKAKEIMLKKDHDYNGVWRTMSQSEIIDEINVKIQRMKSVLEIKKEVSSDNIYDVINYCAFALILIEEKVHIDM
jgi:hypothetical protein